jgi:hypothetical protein
MDQPAAYTLEICWILRAEGSLTFAPQSDQTTFSPMAKIAIGDETRNATAPDAALRAQR